MEKQMLTTRLQLSGLELIHQNFNGVLQTAEEVQDVKTYDADFMIVVIDQKFQRK